MGLTKHLSWLVLSLVATTAAARAHEVYISSEKDNTVSVIDTKSLSVVRTTAAGIGSIGDDNAGPTGARGRIELGLRGRVMNGIGLDLSGTYDGIGTGDYDAFSGRAMVRVPLN